MTPNRLSLWAAMVVMGLSAAAGPATAPATRPGVLAAPVARPSTAPTTLPTLAANSPSTRPAGASGSSPSATTRPTIEAQQVQLLTLSARSIRELEARHFDAAHQSLTQALAIDPHEPTNLYNFACLEALTGHPAEAGAFLQLAAANGFDEFDHVEIDADLASIRDTAAYRDVLAHRAEYQHAAALRAEAVLRRRFGPGYTYEIDDGDKLIFATNTDRRTLEALKRDMTRQARSQWQQLFTHHPEQYIGVVVASKADFDRVRPGPHVEGFYTPVTHTLIASGLGLVTTHEFTHALNFGDIEELGEEQPIWLTEGLAVLYETAQFRGDDVLTPQPNDRLYELQYLKQRDRLIPLARLLRMRQPEFIRRAGPCYAESGGLMAYLYEKGLLRRFYDAYKVGYAKDPTGRIAIEAVTGRPIDQLDKDWQAWVMKQTPPPLFTGLKGAYMGVRFDQANDGLVATDVTAGGPAAKAGVKNGDVLVGLDDIEARDRQAFMGLLVTHKPGERITLNLRRGTEYLNLPVVLGTRPPIVPTTRATTLPALAAGGVPTTMPASAMPTTKPTMASPTTLPATRPG